MNPTADCLVTCASLVVLIGCGSSPAPAARAEPRRAPVPLLELQQTRPEECPAIIAAHAADSAKGRYRPPQATNIVLPVPVRGAEGQAADLHMRVNLRGEVDSVEITGTSHAGFIAALRKTIVGYRFRPATVNGCPVVGWTDMRVAAPPAR